MDGSINAWVGKAKKDIGTAELLLKNGRFEDSAFFSQQAAEKSQTAEIQPASEKNDPQNAPGSTNSDRSDTNYPLKTEPQPDDQPGVLLRYSDQAALVLLAVAGITAAAFLAAAWWKKRKQRGSAA